MLSFREYTQQKETVTQDQLNRIEKYANSIFNGIGITIQFSRHFLERVNDTRNRPPINPRELAQFFTRHFQKNGRIISKLRPGAEAVLKDNATKLNVPIGVHSNRDRRSLLVRPITILRKSNYGSDNFDNKVYEV